MHTTAYTFYIMCIVKRNERQHYIATMPICVGLGDNGDDVLFYGLCSLTDSLQKVHRPYKERMNANVICTVQFLSEC